MEVVEAAKYSAENPSPSRREFLIMDGAAAVCNAQSPTNLTEYLGFDTLDAMPSPGQWFQNTCGPIMYAAENEFEMKSQDIARALSSAGTGTAGGSSASAPSDERSPTEIDFHVDDEDQGVETSRISF
jgi:hypothetical protein